MKFKNKVIVITGASSGIGRATAHVFAEKGARLVLIARREQFLKDVALECQNKGAQSSMVKAIDVSDEQQVQKAVAKIMEEHGRIDVFVNNAAVTLFGRFEEVPPDDFERVIRVNFFGYVYCARAVIPHFREQGRGVLINVSSVVASLSQPLSSAYVISKAAVRSLSNSLRQELGDAPHIHVCTVLPSAMDTPLLQMGANYTGRKPEAISPVYPAEKVANSILSMVRRPRREAIVGCSGRLGMFFSPLFPGLVEKIMTWIMFNKHFSDEQALPVAGNLHEPVFRFNSVSGGRATQEGNE